MLHIVTGCTGFVGRHFIPELLKKKDRVLLIIRSDAKSAQERGEEIFGDLIHSSNGLLSIIEGDVLKKNLGIPLEKIQNEKIKIWHLAANLSFLTHEAHLIQETNVEGAKNVVALANKTRAELMFMSTAYVCGNKKGEILEDVLDSNQKRRNMYEITKYESERIVRSDCKVPYIIFRPSIIIGDAYTGKAKGCTFGYYRFAYMFFVFQKWIRRKIEQKSFLGKIFLLLRTKIIDEKHIQIPWLLIPVPRKSTVNFIPIDVVVKALVDISQFAENHSKTFHLVNRDSPTVEFGTRSLLEDIGYEKVKIIRVFPWMYNILMRTLYVVAFPIRKYLKSALWYMPYVTKEYQFSTKNSDPYLPESSTISREFLQKINEYAEAKIFNTIALEK